MRIVASGIGFAVYARFGPFMLFMQLARLTLVPPYDSNMDVGTLQPVAGSLSRPSRWSKRRKKRFAVDGEEGPQGLIVRQDELEDAPDDQLPPRVGERRGS